MRLSTISLNTGRRCSSREARMRNSRKRSLQNCRSFRSPVLSHSTIHSTKRFLINGEKTIRLRTRRKRRQHMVLSWKTAICRSHKNSHKVEKREPEQPTHATTAMEHLGFHPTWKKDLNSSSRKRMHGTARSAQRHNAETNLRPGKATRSFKRIEAA